MNLDLIPENMPLVKLASAEQIFKSIAAHQIPDLLNELLVNYMKSGAPPLPSSILEHYDFKNLAKFNALRASIRYNRPEDFKLLIKNNACIIFNKNTKCTILHYLVRKCNLEFLKTLFTEFKKNAQALINEIALDKKPKKNLLIAPIAETPLCYAIRSKSNKALECIRLLLAEKASVNAVCPGNTSSMISTPFTLALQTARSFSVIKMLQGAQIDFTSLPESQIISSLAQNLMIDDETKSHFIEFLAQEKINLDTVDQLNTSLIFYAHKWKCDLSLKTLISFGASIAPLKINFKNKDHITRNTIRIIRIADCIRQLMRISNNPLKIILEYTENTYKDHF